MEIKLTENEALEYLQFKKQSSKEPIENNDLSKYRELGSPENIKRCLNNFGKLQKDYNYLSDDYQKTITYNYKIEMEKNESSNQLDDYKNIGTVEQIITLINLIKENLVIYNKDSALYESMSFDPILKTIDNKDSYIYKVLKET